MFKQMAAADAYAVAFEFVEHTPDRVNDGITFHKHPQRPEHVPGRYTDDTIRSMAVADVVLGRKGLWFDPAEYVRAIQRRYEADPRDVWSRRFQAYLADQAADSPQAFMRGLMKKPTNGCVMGVAPIGFLPMPGNVRVAAVMQTVGTHAASAAPYAQAVALAVHHLVRSKGRLSDLIGYVADGVEWDGFEQRAKAVAAMEAEPTKPGMPARDVALAAISHVVRATSQSDMLRKMVGIGGDTDSVAAVGMAIASCSSEIADDLPVTLLMGIEDQEGRKRLDAMDERMTAFLEM